MHNLVNISKIQVNLQQHTIVFSMCGDSLSLQNLYYINSAMEPDTNTIKIALNGRFHFVVLLMIYVFIYLFMHVGRAMRLHEPATTRCLET